MSPFTLLIHILDSAIGHFCPELLSRFQMLHLRASQHVEWRHSRISCLNAANCWLLRLPDARDMKDLLQLESEVTRVIAEQIRYLGCSAINIGNQQQC